MLVRDTLRDSSAIRDNNDIDCVPVQFWQTQMVALFQINYLAQQDPSCIIRVYVTPATYINRILQKTASFPLK